jgi:hypothetical protein
VTRQVFNLAWASLLNGFAGQAERMTGESQDVYWSLLKDIPDDLWLKGVKNCLASCKFFPSIHELGVACCGEQEIISDPFAHLTPWIKPPTRTITWQENLDKILSGQRLAIEPRKATRDGERELPEVRAVRK